jgi:threonine aldolase
MKNTIDYRSDTVTRPTAAMKDFMFQAEVGDDVYGEDPTIKALEEKNSTLFGMEAALFCPSGTMTNQIALALHTRPGDEVICSNLSHIYLYEGSGMAVHAGIQPRLIAGNRGRISANQVEMAINPDDVHKGRSALVSLENTANRGGGSCYEMKDLLEIRAVCQKHGIGLHLDGARLFNAIIAKEQNAKEYGQIFDTISICLSKGLGAPVGSLLLGNKDHIHQAKRIRKRMGGGMRQAGMLAAAGIYALDHHVDRLAEDHQHALMLEQSLQACSAVHQVMPVETNIVIFDLKEGLLAGEVCQSFKNHGILMSAISNQQIRLVTHLDISASDVELTIDVIKKNLN